MADLGAGWMALISASLAAVGTAIGVFLRSKQKDIDDRDATIKAQAAEIAGMRERELLALHAQLLQALGGKKDG